MALTAFCTLAACGGGGGTDDETVVLPAGPPAYRAMIVEFLDLGEKFLDYSDAGNVGTAPTSDVTFDGVLAVISPTDDNFGGYAGDFSATYTFATETIDGEANGFFFDGNTDSSVASTGVAVPGTVTVDGDTITAGVIEVTLGGTLDSTAVSGTGDAFFAGPDGDMLNGFVENVTAVGETNLEVLILAD